MRLTRVSLIASLFALLSACAGLRVRGSVGMQTIETRVDSEAARYYLEHYLPGNRMDTELDERIDRVYQSANGSLPDRNELKHLSDDFSVDFAALYFADQITHSPVNRRLSVDCSSHHESPKHPAFGVFNSSSCASAKSGGTSLYSKSDGVPAIAVHFYHVLPQRPERADPKPDPCICI